MHYAAEKNCFLLKNEADLLSATQNTENSIANVSIYC